jgi:hypothetical protein
MRNTETASATLSVAFLLAASCAADTQIGEVRDIDAGIGTVSQESIFATCDDIHCANANACAQQCEDLYGASSGKPYRLDAGFEGPPACQAGTNSDCYSICFRNCCRCGSTGAGNADCQGQPQHEGPANCHCARSTGGIHNFWCCTGDTTTFDGWSCADRCGAGGDVTTPIPGEPSNPANACIGTEPHCDFDGNCAPEHGETCDNCVTDCCNETPDT